MSVKQLKDGTIVISGFEKGIADSPHVGAGDMRNVNLATSPGEASVNFKTAAMTIPPSVTGLAFTVETTDIFTVSSTSGWYNGMGLFLATLVNGTGLSTNRPYWVGDLSGNTFKLYTNPAIANGISTPVNVTLAGSGTLTTYTLTASGYTTQQWTIDNSRQFPYEFFIDGAGRVWWFNNYVTSPGTPSNVISYMGNTTLTFGNGEGIVAYEGYLLVFRATAVDYLRTNAIANGSDINSSWVYGWQTVGGGAKEAMVGTDNVVYWRDSNSNVGSLSTVAGSTFNPATSSTFVYNRTALDLPNDDEPQCFAELGSNLIIGSKLGFIYPWDRISPSFDIPVQLPERNVVKLMATNNLAYAFCGARGFIYATNGASYVEYRKIPDYVTGEYMPYFAWVNALIWRNKLFFSFTAKKNDTTTLTTVAGIWSIDLTTEALIMTNKMSYDTYAGVVNAIIPNIMTATPPGNGLIATWKDGSNVAGVDQSSLEPYQNFQAAITTEIIPVGTYIEKYTPSTFEFKLSRPLVSGEQFRLSVRPTLADSFTLLGTTTTSTLISSDYDTAIQDMQWAQFLVEYSSTASSPSYVPLTEISFSNTG